MSERNVGITYPSTAAGLTALGPICGWDNEKQECCDPTVSLIWSYPLSALFWKIENLDRTEVKYVRVSGAEEPEDRVLGTPARVSA